MEPVTRRGMFMDAICDGEPCGLEPVTREEIMLKRLSESGGGSGSGGGGVHTVEIIAAGPGSSGTYADWNEAVNAVKSGKVLCCDYHTIDSDDHMYSTMVCVDTAEGIDQSTNSRVPVIVFIFMLPAGMMRLVWNPDGTVLQEGE